MMSLNIALLFGSVRNNRQGIKAAKYIQDKLAKRNHKVFFIDPIEYNLPLLYKRYKDYSKEDVPENLEKLAKIYRSADALVIVTAEYNHSFPPALKNLIDHFYEEYFWKPSAIVSYSITNFGGARAAIALRPVLSEVGMPSIPSVFSISNIAEALNDDGEDVTGLYDKRIDKFLNELEWYALALKEQRKKGTPY